MEWFKGFWGKHGERFIYMALSLALAKVMYSVGLDKEANVIIIGAATICVNKMRSGNGVSKKDES